MERNKMLSILDSGMVDDYCLGLLDTASQNMVIELMLQNPEVDCFVQSSLDALEMYAGELAVFPSFHLRSEISDLLEQLEMEQEAFENGHIPLIHAQSDREQWQRVLEKHKPAGSSISDHSHTLVTNDKCLVIAIWSTSGIPEETHDHTRESFLILEGVCECIVGKNKVRLRAGDYFEIPMHVNHSVRVIEPLAGILQRVKVG